MSTASLPAGPGWRTPLVVIVAGCLIAMIGFGIRSVFGLFLEPMTIDRGWDRETFGLALAIQNLLWGFGVPVAGMIADRFGPSRVLAVGAVVYMIGVWGMATVESALALHVFAGVLTGLGVAFTAFSLAMAAMAKVVGPERRSMALGLGTAAGSFGQVVFSPLGQGFIAAYGWESALLILSVTALIIIPLAFVLPSDTSAKGEAPSDQTLRQALSEAGAHRGYVLLTIGFFVCGFHVAFIIAHMPAYLSDLGFGPELGGIALALIGLCNVAGSLAAGAIGQRMSKAYALSALYFMRSLVIIGFVMLPVSAASVLVFSAAMGVLWLSTVPLTSGLVAVMFGPRYMATLFGVVFFSHQVGSFFGVWLGGVIYVETGSYDMLWWIGILLGFAAALVHLPIRDAPAPRPAAALS